VTAPSPQRLYQAVCPNCGAGVRFASSASTHVVCGYCRSSLARQGDVLKKLGEVAEVFEDYSPLQIGSSGKHVGAGFVLIGRLQYSGDAGSWNEWRVLFDDGRTGWLSEDNGRYVMGLDADKSLDVSIYGALSSLKLGQSITVNQQAYSVTSVVKAKLHTAQGELPKSPRAGQTFTVVECRNPEGAVASLDDAGVNGQDRLPNCFISTSVELSRLQLHNLRELVEKSLKSLALACPNCGVNIDLQQATSKAVVCPSCRAVVNVALSKPLNFTLQKARFEPTLALGTIGTLKGVDWQIVSYQQRNGVASGDDYSQFTWAEYVLYNRKEGFAFLVETSEGWALMLTSSGVPNYKNQKNGSDGYAVLGGRSFTTDYSYTATTTFALGEFYWPVVVGYKTFNTDFSNGASLLGREQAGQEVVWSVGEKVSDHAIGLCFGTPEQRKECTPIQSAFQGGRKPQSFVDPKEQDEHTQFWMNIGFWVILLLIYVLYNLYDNRQRCYKDQFGVEQCERRSGGSYSGSGGNWGGTGSSGGHK
jgi:Zn-finger nucleic acid-binding protein